MALVSPNTYYSQYQIFKIIFSILKKKHWENIDNPLVKKYENKRKNRITFKIKTRYYLELLTPEKKKLLGRTEKETKNKNIDNKPHLDITEKVLFHCNIVNNDYQQNSRVLYTFVPNKPF